MEETCGLPSCMSFVAECIEVNGGGGVAMWYCCRILERTVQVYWVCTAIAYLSVSTCRSTCCPSAIWLVLCTWQLNGISRQIPRTVLFAPPAGQRSCHHERYFADRSGAFQGLVLQRLLVVRSSRQACCGVAAAPWAPVDFVTASNGRRLFSRPDMLR